MNKKFIGQHKEETVLFCWRRHAYILLAPFIKFFFLFNLAIIALIFLIYFSDKIENNIFISLFALIYILILYSIHYIFFNLLNFLASPVLLTKERLIKIRTKLFLSSKLEMIYIKEMQDIHYEKKWLIKNLFDFGNIYITSSSLTKPFKISCMSKPIDKLTFINNQKVLTKKKPTQKTASSLLKKRKNDHRISFFK